jgi:hypothetical protein
MSAAQAAAVASTAEIKLFGNRPVDKIRIGNITAAIFENSGQNGKFYSVKLERSYKEGETWKNTDIDSKCLQNESEYVSLSLLEPRKSAGPLFT